MKTKEEVVMHDCPAKFLSKTKLYPIYSNDNVYVLLTLVLYWHWQT